jgi:transcriptional regulator with XRE-family HTH domain
VPSRTNPIHEASRLSTWVLLEIGRELRLARIVGGMTQGRVGGMLRVSGAHVSRIEHGKVTSASVSYLMRHAAAVGLRLYTRTFPAGRRILDGPQLDLLNAFNRRLHASWRRELEVPVPIAGDYRAADEVIRIPTCSCAVEAITRFADFQAQSRAAHVKARDLGVDRLILVVKGSHANRRALREASRVARDAFPVGTREALRALAAGRDPGGDAFLLL